MNSLLNKKFFILLLLILAYSIYDRFLWSNIAQWHSDQATHMWIGLTQKIDNISVGLISSVGLPNPNGMVFIAKALTYLPSLWSVSFVISLIQLFLIIILGLVLFKKNKNLFFLFIIPIIFCVALRSSSVQFVNQWILVSVNLFYFILIALYLNKPSPLRFIFLLIPMLIAPSIYLAGLANSLAFFLCSLLALYFHPLPKNLKIWIFPMILGIFFLFLSLKFTWLPYYYEININDIILSNNIDIWERISLTINAAIKFPYWSIIHGAGNISGSFVHNGYDSVTFPFWSITHYNNEAVEAYKILNGPLSNNAVFGLRLTSLILILQAILSTLLITLVPLFNFAKYRSFKNIIKNEKKIEFEFLMITIIFIFTVLVFATFLGAPDWINGKRLDHQVQFLPFLIIIWFVIPWIIKLPKFLNKSLNNFFIFLFFSYILLSILTGYQISKDYNKYNGTMITEADVPLIQKKEAIKFIANDWKLKSDSKSIPVAYFFNDRRWSEVNKFGEKLSKYYPNISTLGREYDYELLRSHGLFNTQEGIQHRNFKNIRYIICYNSIPIRIKKSLISEIKIIGQLKIIKLININ